MEFATTRRLRRHRETSNALRTRKGSTVALAWCTMRGGVRAWVPLRTTHSAKERCMNKRLWWTWVVLVSVTLAACSSDDGDDGSTPLAGAGAGGVGGVGGAAGASGAGAGAGGVGGMGGTAGMAPAAVPCGTATCMGLSIPLPIALPQACCADAATNTCGTMPAAGGVCMPPMQPDPRCPVVSGPIPLISCCAPNGMCGLDATTFNMGCVDFAAVASGPFGSFLPVPAPVSCDGGGDGGVADDDAGI
jgi:hypothetical protein